MEAVDDSVVVAKGLRVVRLEVFGSGAHKRFQNGDCKTGAVHAEGAVRQIGTFVFDHETEPSCEPFLERRGKEFYGQCQEDGVLRRVIGIFEAPEGPSRIFRVGQVDKCGNARFSCEGVCIEIAAKARVDGAGRTVKFLFAHACGADFPEIGEFINSKLGIVFCIVIHVLDIAHFEPEQKTAFLLHGYGDVDGRIFGVYSKDFPEAAVMDR